MKIMKSAVSGSVASAARFQSFIVSVCRIWSCPTKSRDRPSLPPYKSTFHGVSLNNCMCSWRKHGVPLWTSDGPPIGPFVHARSPMLHQGVGSVLEKRYLLCPSVRPCLGFASLGRDRNWHRLHFRICDNLLMKKIQLSASSTL